MTALMATEEQQCQGCGSEHCQGQKQDRKHEQRGTAR